MRKTHSKRRWRRWLFGMPLLLAVLSVLPVLALRWLDPPGSMFILHARWEAWQAGRELRIAQTWAPATAISKQLALAVVAAEDQRFAAHHGFDLDAIEQAWRASAGRGRGASTISQQVAKNLFLWPERSWLRKGLEVWFTAWIELLWPKQRILEMYCNLAEFGVGLYGAEAAAQRYFGVSAAALNSEQAARLAAVLPSPRRYSATAPGPYVRGRIGWIRQQMGQLGPGWLDGIWPSS